MNVEEGQQNKTILVVDPDKEFCSNVRLFLEENYQVKTHQGLEYIDYTITLHKINLLVVDADYADKKLVELLSNIKLNHSKIKIIIMYTYFPSDKIIERALARNADDMIEKPFDVSLLKTKADRLLNYSPGN